MLLRMASLRRLLLVKIVGAAAWAVLSGGPRGGKAIGEGMLGVPAGELRLRRVLRWGSDVLELVELTADGKPEFSEDFGRDTIRFDSSVVLPEWLADPPESELFVPDGRSAAAVKVRVKYWSSSVAHTEIIILACMCASANAACPVTDSGAGLGRPVCESRTVEKTISTAASCTSVVFLMAEWLRLEEATE